MKKLFTYLPLLFLLIGCSGVDHFPEPAKGDIIGYIELNADGEFPLQGSQSGVRVILEGANPAMETTTDEDGKWVFHDVPAGTYELTFKKEGFADFKLFSVGHVGGEKPTVPFDGRMVILQKTATKVSAIKATVKNDDVTVVVTLASQGFGRIFIGKSGINSPTSYTLNNLISFTGNTVIYSINELRKYGFKSGDEVSMKAYGSVTSYYYYFDPHFGMIIYPNLSDEFKEVKFKIP